MPLQVYARFGFLPGREMVDLAPLVEEAGFAGGLMPDHVFMPHAEPGAYPYSPDGEPTFPPTTPFADPFVTIAALAAVTRTMRFCSSVYILPLRHPLIAARAVGTAAVMSGGRVSLAVGVGWMREEFDEMGETFENRGARTDEMIEALRTLWHDSPAQHRGRFYSFGPLYMEPRPAELVPILVGGSSAPALRRAARLGDGALLPVMPSGEVSGVLERLNELLADNGRDRSGFQVLLATDDVTDPEELIHLAELGVDAVGVRPWPNPVAPGGSFDGRRRALENFATTVLEPTRSALAGR
jgi:probable F420-dependent oxidoreductase